MAKRYRALAGLDYPTDPKVIKRLLAGEDVPWGERKMKRVEAGQAVSDIPAASVRWLLEGGLIEEVTDD